MNGVGTKNLSVERPALQGTAKKAGQACTEPPDLRWNFAQGRIREFPEQSFTCENFLSEMSREKGPQPRRYQKWGLKNFYEK